MLNSISLKLIFKLSGEKKLSCTGVENLSEKVTAEPQELGSQCPGEVPLKEESWSRVSA